MNLVQWAAATMLALGAILAMSGIWRARRQRTRAVTVALLVLQPLLALSLYLALFPPSRALPAGTLQVIGPAGPGASMPRADSGIAIALPEAQASSSAARTPDLATALRQRPATRVEVIGAYLPARDRDALAGRSLHFDPPAPPDGLVEINLPPPLAPGSTFSVAGRVHGMPGARIALHDPAGKRIASLPPGADGRFIVQAQAGAAGEALFSLHLLDSAGRQAASVPVPVVAAAAPPLKLLVLAGAPQPELKYLRRWALDAGLSLQTRIATGGGLFLGEAPAVLDATTLDGLDLVVLDDRALAGLPARERAALGAAMQRGLGVLLRTGGPLEAGARLALRDWGLPLAGDAATAVLAAPAASPGDVADVALPALTRRRLAPATSTSAQVLAHDARGDAYAWWRPVGRGRLGVSTLTDSYLWTLAGRQDLHAALWSTLLSPLARPRGAAPPVLLDVAWAGTRATLCGLGDDATVTAPDGERARLIPDPTSGARDCAGYWPLRDGWHVLRSSRGRLAFYVQDPAKASAWFTQIQRDATLAQVGEAAGEGTARPDPPRVPAPRWPAWLAFVCLAATAWWLERRRGAAPRDEAAASS